MAMVPHERSLVEQLENQPFALIGVNGDQDLKNIRETVKAKNITWRSFWSGPEGANGPIPTEWRVGMWPTVYLIDAQGVIRYKNPGSSLNEALETLLAEMGHEVELSSREHE